jgi:hypothetical protein
VIDLKEYALVSRKDDDAVMVQHLPCGDLNGVANLDEAVAWAGDHVCGQ